VRWVFGVGVGGVGGLGEVRGGGGGTERNTIFSTQNASDLPTYLAEITSHFLTPQLPGREGCGSVGLRWLSGYGAWWRVGDKVDVDRTQGSALVGSFCRVSSPLMSWGGDWWEV